MYNSAVALLKGIRSEFAKQLGSYEGPMFKPFVQMVKSDALSEDYRFLDALPYIKEWKDKRHIQDFKDFVYTVRNKHWDIGMDVHKDTFEDSKKTLGGNIEKDVRTMAEAWKNFPDKLIYDLLIANGTAYDASTFFATSHNIDGTNAIDNLKTGTQTGTYTLSQIEADFKTAKTAMTGYRDKNDQPINPNPRWLVLCGHDVEDQFKTLQASKDVYISGTKTNIYQGSFEIMVNNWQDTADYDWYLINLNASVLPFIHQERQTVKWDIKDDPENIFIRYLTDQRSNAGYAAFTSILKVNN